LGGDLEGSFQSKPADSPRAIPFPQSQGTAPLEVIRYRGIPEAEQPELAIDRDGLGRQVSHALGTHLRNRICDGYRFASALPTRFLGSWPRSATDHLRFSRSASLPFNSVTFTLQFVRPSSAGPALPERHVLSDIGVGVLGCHLMTPRTPVNDLRERFVEPRWPDLRRMRV